MEVYFSALVTQKSVTYVVAAHTFDGMKLLKDGYCMVLPDICIWNHTTGSLEIELEWTGLRNHCASAKLFGLMASLFDQLRRSNCERFVKSLLWLCEEKKSSQKLWKVSYTRAFEKNYGVGLVNVPIIDIVEGLTASKLLAASFGTTYIH